MAQGSDDEPGTRSDTAEQHRVVPDRLLRDRKAVTAQSAMMPCAGEPDEGSSNGADQEADARTAEGIAVAPAADLEGADGFTWPSCGSIVKLTREYPSWRAALS